MSNLADRDCVPCKGGVPPLTPEQIAPLLAQLEGWKIDKEGQLYKRYRLKDFAGALALVDKLGAIAEQQGHHPDLHLNWGNVWVRLMTHAIQGLTENDFILAARFDAVAKA